MGKGLRGVLTEAQAKGSAVGHFNISDIAILKAVVGGARDNEDSGNRRRVRGGTEVSSVVSQK